MNQYASKMFVVDGAAGNLVPAKAHHYFRLDGGLIQAADSTVATITLKDDETDLTGPISMDQSGAAGLPFICLPHGVNVTQLDLDSSDTGEFTGWVAGQYVPNGL